MNSNYGDYTFHEAVEELIRQYESGKRSLHGGAGLCHELYRMTRNNIVSYSIVRCFVTDDQNYYNKGMGPSGIFTEDRYNLLLLIRLFSVKELNELLSNSEEFLGSFDQLPE